MAVRPTDQTVQLRAEEEKRKEGLTFKDLCELVDKGRERGIDPNALVLGDYWIRNRIDGRDGYRPKWLEV